MPGQAYTLDDLLRDDSTLQRKTREFKQHRKAVLQEHAGLQKAIEHLQKPLGELDKQIDEFEETEKQHRDTVLHVRSGVQKAIEYLQKMLRQLGEQIDESEESEKELVQEYLISQGHRRSKVSFSLSGIRK